MSQLGMLGTPDGLSCKPTWKTRHGSNHRDWTRRKQDSRRTRGVRRLKRKSLREQMFDNLGHQCSCCGESNKVFLTLEHLDGRGAEHRRKRSSNSGILVDVKREGWPKDKYTVLCFNCNCGKAKVGQCPHNYFKDRFLRGSRFLSGQLAASADQGHALMLANSTYSLDRDSELLNLDMRGVQNGQAASIIESPGVRHARGPYEHTEHGEAGEALRAGRQGGDAPSHRVLEGKEGEVKHSFCGCR